MIRSYYLTPDSNSKLLVDITKESDKLSTKSSIKYLAENNLDSDDFHGSMVDVSDQIKNNSDSFELLQNVEQFGENVSGTYYCKKY